MNPHAAQAVAPAPKPPVPDLKLTSVEFPVAAKMKHVTQLIETINDKKY